MKHFIVGMVLAAAFVAVDAQAAICNADNTVCCSLYQNPCRYVCTDGGIIYCKPEPKPKPPYRRWAYDPPDPDQMVFSFLSDDPET